MNAWHKALENVWRCVMADVTILCSGKGDGSGCEGEHREDQVLDCPTKLEAVRNAKEKGWTYDKEGNWLCPECTNNNKQTTTQGE